MAAQAVLTSTTIVLAALADSRLRQTAKDSVCALDTDLRPTVCSEPQCRWVARASLVLARQLQIHQQVAMDSGLPRFVSAAEVGTSQLRQRTSELATKTGLCPK